VSKPNYRSGNPASLASEYKLVRLNRDLRLLSMCNQLIVHAEDERQLLSDMCKLIVEKGGYKLAWVGIAHHDKEKTVEPVAYFGIGKKYIENARISWSGTSFGHGPAGTVIRTGNPVIVQDTFSDPGFAPWRPIAVRFGFHSGVDLPIKINRSTIGVLGIFAAEANAFDKAEEKLLLELAGDLSYSIKSLREREERAKAEKSLAESEERYSTTLDNMIDGCQIIGFDWRYLYINDAAAGHGRKKKEELVGKTMMEAYPGIEKTEMFAQLKKCMKQRVPVNMDNQFTYPDGGRGWFKLSMTPVPRGVLILSEDVTAHRRAEEALRKSEIHYRNLFDSVVDGVVVLDDRGFVTSVNRAVIRRYGHDPGYFIGKRFARLGIFPSRQRAALEGLFSKKPGDRAHETEVKARSGESIPSELITTSLVVEGKMAGFIVIMRDLSERKKAEAALNLESRLINSTLDSVYLLNPSGRILYANDGMLRMHGYSQDEVLKLRIQDLSDRPNRLAVPERMERIVGERYHTFETVHVRKDGSNFPVEVHASSIMVDGKRTILVVARDITERKKTEKELVNLRLGFEYTDQILFMTDKEGVFTYANPAFERTYGYSRGDIVGKVTPRILKSGQSKRKYYTRFWKLLLSKKTVHAEIVNKAKDGRFINIIETVNPALDEAGNITGFLAIQSDITERKRSEAELSFKTALLEAENETTKDGIMVVDDKGEILLVNRAFEELMSLPKSLRGTHDDKKVLSFVTPKFENPKQFLARVKYLYAHPRENGTDVVQFKDGRVFERYTSALQIGPDKVLGRIWYFHEITEHKKYEAYLARYQTELEDEVRQRTAQLEAEKKKVVELSQAKDNFIRDMSHELKTPLAVMLGNISLVRKIVKPEAKSTLETILTMLERNGVRLHSSINEILQLSKLDSLEIRHDPVQLKDVLGEVFSEYLPLAQLKGIELKLDAQPVSITGDAQMLRLSFSNLVSNAIKFTDKGSVSIALEAGGQDAIVRVSDTGIGISPEHQKMLFQKFFKANPEAPGTGIGLVIIKGIIDKHGGSIKVESSFGKGTAFKLSIPKGG